MRNYEILKASYKSHNYNEDRILVKEDMAIVMDGASSLSPSDMRPTSASWLVNRLKEGLKRKTGNVIEKLNDLSKQLYVDYGKKSNALYLPSCGMAICLLEEDKVRFFVIGDCEITYLTKDNQVHSVKRCELNMLDEGAIAEMVKISKEKKISILDARKEINDLLIKNRQKMNKENGYPVYTISNNPDFQFLEFECDIDQVKSIYLYSDGFAQAFTTLTLYQYENLFKKDFDIVKVKDQIVKAWKDDPLCEKYPRFKKSDDISIVKIRMID